MLELINITAKAKNFILKDISLKITEGSSHVIIGPTGSGKTFLLESILGIKPILYGKILLNGIDITQLNIKDRKIAYLPQDIVLFPHLTVKNNIFYPLRFNSQNTKDIIEIVNEVCNILDINNLLNRSTLNLSLGEKQRVAFARAIATGYKLWLLDEPFCSLHESLKKELWFLLKNLQYRFNFTILMVTHDLKEAFFLGDKLTVLINGVIHKTDNKYNVYNYPETIEMAKFMGISNLFDAYVKELDKEYIKVYCKTLNKELIVKKNKLKGLSLNENIVIGIREEKVQVIDIPNKNNVIYGEIIQTFEKGRFNTVIFKAKETNQTIEIEVNKDMDLTKINSIYLNEKDIFYIK